MSVDQWVDAIPFSETREYAGRAGLRCDLPDPIWEVGYDTSGRRSRAIVWQAVASSHLSLIVEHSE